MSPSTPSIPARGPHVFIGSSSEGLDTARALQVLLDRDCDTQLWPQSLFAPGRSYLESLVRALPAYDFAVLVISPDDQVESRGELHSAPRDNILFELGLFMGRLGRDRAFAVYDRTRPLKLPSDFAGIKLIDYAPSKHGLDAALGAASTQILRAIAGSASRTGETDRRLEELQQTVIASGEIGPSEQGYFDKFSQIMNASGSSELALLYADIDGLRSITRKLFLAEKDRRLPAATNLGRRPESDIRSDLVLALNVSITDAVYQLDPDGLKHDIFGLPDPDVVVIARKLSYEKALRVAERAQSVFTEEAARLVSVPPAEGPSVTFLVSTLSMFADERIKGGPAAIHKVLRGSLKQLKEKAGRGRVYGREALTQSLQGAS